MLDFQRFNPRHVGSLAGLALLVSTAAGAAQVRAATADADTPSSSLVIEIPNVQNGDGQVLVSLFRGSEGFPGKHQRAFRTARSRATSGTVRFTLEDLPPGTYGVAVIHDENGNAKLDTNLFGIPSEGWGTSRNPRPKVRAPRWSESSFSITADARARQRIKLLYP